MAWPAVLQYREFRAFLGFRAFMTFGLQMQAVVLGYHLYSITHDPLSLGFVGLAEALPAICMALFGGHVADRSEKRGMLQTIALCMAGLAAAIGVAHYAVEAGQVKPATYTTLLYSFIFLGGIVRGFYSPAGSALTGLLVPPAFYPKAAAYSSISWQTAAILGPTAGGFLYAGVGPAGVQGVVLACLLGGFFAMSFVDRKPPSAALVKGESIFTSIREGMQFVRGQRLLLGAITLDMFSVFFGGVVALLPIFALDILNVGAQGLGMLRGADAFGSVTSMVILSQLGAFKKPWRSLLISVAAFGIAIIGFGLSTNFYLSLGWLVLVGCADGVSVVIRSTLIQTLTPNHMRGRVSSISSIFVSSSNEIGSFESGFTARLMGTVPATLFGGAMTLGIVGFFSLFKTREMPTVAPSIIEAIQEAEREKEPPTAG